MGDIPDQFILVVADDPHGIVHLNFVKGVGGKDFIPVIFCGISQNGKPGLAMIASKFVNITKVVFGYSGLDFFLVLLFDPKSGSVLFVIQGTCKIKQGGGNVDMTDQTFMFDSTFVFIRITNYKRNFKPSFIYRGFATCECHPVV